MCCHAWLQAGKGLYESICSTSQVRLTARAPAGKHMRQHGENTNFRSRMSSEWCVFDIFFRKLWDHLKWCFMMFFDVLELREPSWNDSGSILDHYFFMFLVIFFAQNDNLYLYFSIYSLHIFKICSMQFELKYYFEV